MPSSSRSTSPDRPASKAQRRTRRPSSRGAEALPSETSLVPVDDATVLAGPPPEVSCRPSSAARTASRPARTIRPVLSGPSMVLPGSLRTHVRGFGFVETKDGSVFVPPKVLRGLFDMDDVSVTFVREDDGRFLAQGVSLLQQTRTSVYGLVVMLDGTLCVRPDPHVYSGPPLPLTLGSVLPVAPGVAVVAELDVVSGTCSPTRVFLDPADPAALRCMVGVRHLVKEKFSPEETSEAVALAKRSARPGLSPARRDLRDLPTFTVDSPSSMDLDDALSVLPAGPDGGLRVFVHVADVGEHVLPGSLLDVSAAASATSVYLPGHTYPMLPRELSEAALSLLPGVERDALTVEMRLTPTGEVTSVDLFETRIVSDARLSYTLVAEVLAGGEPDDLDDDTLETLRWLRTAAARLGLQRQRRGGVESRRVEPEVNVTVKDGALSQYAPEVSNPAHLLVERLMVAANEAVASWLLARGLPALLRRHDRPGPEAAQEMEVFARNMGFFPGFGADLSPLSLAALEVQVASAPSGSGALWEVMLRHLGRASYTTEVVGHFGLGSDAYLHFTSPLRRYADLVVHRLVKLYLQGERSLTNYPSTASLDLVADVINERAQRAKQAESQMRRALWLVTLDGEKEVLSGRVTGVLPKGLLVTLEGSLVTGMVSYASLKGGPFRPDALRHRATGDKETFELGQSVRVRVSGVEVESGSLDLVVVSHPVRARRRSRRS